MRKNKRKLIKSAYYQLSNGHLRWVRMCKEWDAWL